KDETGALPQALMANLYLSFVPLASATSMMGALFGVFPSRALDNSVNEHVKPRSGCAILCLFSARISMYIELVTVASADAVMLCFMDSVSALRNCGSSSARRTARPISLSFQTVPSRAILRLSLG